MPYHVNGTVETVKFLREAADVQRTHTLRSIGEYSVGHHSFNMLAMLRVLWVEAPKELIWAILEHDIPERLTGDIPAPTKWFGIIDRDTLTILEGEIIFSLLGTDHEGGLGPELTKWLRGLDILELYLWSRDQIALGNTNAHVMRRRIEKYMEENPEKFAKKVLDFYYECKMSPWEMLPDLGEVTHVGE